MTKLLKLKGELDMLELDVQLRGLKYHSLLVNETREVGSLLPQIMWVKILSTIGQI